MTRNTPVKKNITLRFRFLSRNALCALCLLLSAALLAACAPDASGVSETADSGLSAAAVSGAGAPVSLSGEAGFGMSGSGASDSGAPGSGASNSGVSGTGASAAGAAGAPGAEGIATPDGASSGASVSAAGTDSPADDENLCRLPLAPGIGTEFPEADRALALTDGTVALHLDASEFVLGTDGAIGYTIENTTGHSVYVVFAPRLERWADGTWEWVPGSGFGCGMPDPVDETYSDSLPLERFSGLTEGIYRLTYTLYDSDTARLPSDEPAFSACFYLGTS